jgi:hypothetical protein
MNPFRRQCFHEGGYRLVGTLDLNGPDGSPWPRPRRDTVRIILLKVVLPLAIIGASIIALTILQLNGTLQDATERYAPGVPGPAIDVRHAHGRVGPQHRRLRFYLHADHGVEFHQARPAAASRPLIMLAIDTLKLFDRPKHLFLELERNAGLGIGDFDHHTPPTTIRRTETLPCVVYLIGFFNGGATASPRSTAA